MPHAIDVALQNAVQTHLPTWKCCFPHDVVARINAICVDLAPDVQLAAISSRVHRPRRDPRRMSDHVRISLEDYSTLVRRCLAAGFTIQFVPDRRPKLATVQVTQPEDWRFNAAELQSAVRAISWPDNELIAFLTFGGYDYSADTPSVSWFSPHSSSVYKEWQEIANSSTKEIRLGWMKGPYAFIPTITFRIVPGAAIQKPSQPNRFRTIWNDSIPSPMMDYSAIRNGNGIELPVASNAAARMHSYMAMDWLSIERVALSLHILADTALKTGEELRG